MRTLRVYLVCLGLFGCSSDTSTEEQMQAGAANEAAPIATSMGGYTSASADTGATVEDDTTPRRDDGGSRHGSSNADSAGKADEAIITGGAHSNGLNAVGVDVSVLEAGVSTADMNDADAAG